MARVFSQAVHHERILYALQEMCEHAKEAYGTNYARFGNSLSWSIMPSSAMALGAYEDGPDGPGLASWSLAYYWIGQEGVRNV